MKILYVTTAWTGLSDIIFKGKVDAEGMPAFIKPLKELINRGNEIDIILIHNLKPYPEYNIKVKWINESQIIGQVYWKHNYLKRINSIYKLKTCINNAIKSKNYNFIYGQGTSADIARVIAQKNKIPFGHRLYGTFLYDYIDKNNKLSAFIFHNLEYRAFKSKKSFLLVTNDGSKGDYAVKKINNNYYPYEFRFWLNGINHMPDISPEALERKIEDFDKTPFLFYVARLDRWKRQDYAIKILKELNNRGINIKLYIAGQRVDEKYYNELKQLIVNLKLEDKVIFLGAIGRNEINFMSKAAIASFSLYDMCNLGNVFHEMLSAGAVIISRNDGSLDDFIVNGYNGFLIDNIDDGVNCVIKVLNDPGYRRSIRNNAIYTSRNKMKTWEERVDDEIKLIEKYANSDKRASYE